MVDLGSVNEYLLKQLVLRIITCALSNLANLCGWKYAHEQFCLPIMISNLSFHEKKAQTFSVRAFGSWAHLYTPTLLFCCCLQIYSMNISYCHHYSHSLRNFSSRRWVPLLSAHPHIDTSENFRCICLQSHLETSPPIQSFENLSANTLLGQKQAVKFFFQRE